MEIWEECIRFQETSQRIAHQIQKNKKPQTEMNRKDNTI